MLDRACRLFGGIAALLCAQCGYVGLDLLPLDGEVDAGPNRGEGGAPDANARDGAALDADNAAEDASSDDAGAEDAGPGDASAGDASTGDASAGDASVADAGAGDAGADAAVDGQVIDAGDPNASDAATSFCDLSGDWVAKLLVSVTWPATPGVVAGGGTSVVWLRYQTSAGGAIVPGSSAACGVTLPSTTTVPALGSQTFQPQVPNTLFDAVPTRVTGSGGAITTGGTGTPGDMFSLAPLTFLLGATLSDPAGSAWPSAASLLPMQVDHDMDGAPGVTLSFPNGVYPVVDFNGNRADQAYFAARFTFNGALTLASCDQLSGLSTVSRFDTHFLGCHLVGGGTCSAAQRDQFDGARPIYTANSANLIVRKVANATCALARSTLP